MKTSYCVLILAVTAVLGSCNKDSRLCAPADEKTLPGVWELRAVSGGMVAYNPDNYKPGNGNLWTFTQTNFTRVYKDSVNRSGIYSVSKDGGTDLNTGRTIDRFIFNNEPAESFELRDDTLRFYYGFIPADGDIEMYVKIRGNQELD